MTGTPARPPRPVFRHADMARLFNPASIAIIGASTNPKSVGARTLANMSRYQGRVHLINPRYETIGDRPCYPSVKALPESPDCVVIAVPKDAVEAAVRECAEARVGGVVVFASGYSELGTPELIAMQDRLTAICRESGLRMIGPNTLGFVNFTSTAMVSFASGELKVDPPSRPGVGVVSQSGAVGFSLGQSEYRGVTVSHVLTFGNGADVAFADQIAFLAEDPACASIACLFEGMPHPEQLLEAGEIAWKAGKTVVICKLGVGEEASTAALSHTGSLTGSAEAWDALFERAGFVVVKSIEALMETASFFAKMPYPPQSRGVATLGASGGALIAATDAAEAQGIATPQPPEEMKQRLRPFVPEFGALRNPCDLTAMAVSDPKTVPSAIEAMLTGDTYGALVNPQSSLSSSAIERRALVSDVGRRLKKPICQPFMGGWIAGKGSIECEQDPYIQWFSTLERCYATLAAWHHYHDLRQQRGSQGARKPVRLSPADAKDKAAKLIAAAKNQALTEREAKDVLALYGVPVVGEKLVQSAADAVSAAQALGLPVVMKVESPDIPHKTEANVIRLNLKTADEVKAAYDAVMANAKQYKADAKINGVLVQPMVPSGTEIMVGGKIDPLFGPLIVAGLGGVLVELLKDTALELAPITKTEAQAMLGRLKGQAMLKGFRGAQPVDQPQLAEVIVRLAEFLDDQQSLIAELDVNPLICSGSRILAVDALIIKKA
jgi:acyl-CoA synthetase (NDP forming)